MIWRFALLLCLAGACRTLPTAHDFGWADQQSLGALDAAPHSDSKLVSDTCGNGECDADETLFSCLADCGALAARRAGPCAAPGTPDNCPAGLTCVLLSAAAGGASCIADFPTWQTLPLGRAATDFAGQGDVVLDAWTGLRWASDPLENMTFSNATTACTQQTFGGRHDWRLPTRAELQTLVDYSPSDGRKPALLVAALQWPKTTREFWTANHAPNPADGALSISFAQGWTYAFPLTDLLAARCVSASGTAAKSIQRFEVLANGAAALDRISGRTWQRMPQGPATWPQANNACLKNLPGLPGAGWRLPNVRELDDIVEMRTQHPMLDDVFSDNPASTYWSATPIGSTMWQIDIFRGGAQAAANTSNLFHFRCVR